MQTYRGTVKGKIVVLHEGADLPDGQEVEVRAVQAHKRPVVASQWEEVDPEEAFLQHLLEIGLISGIKHPGPTEPPGDRRPIEVKGKPLSEMIIEERR